MPYHTLILSVADNIGTITINRPDKLNALNDQMADELLLAMKEFTQNPEVRVIVITGQGKAFSAGADVLESLLKPVLEKRSSRIINGAWPEEICTLFRRCPKPIIASVNGVAVGFGCAVCLSSDIRIAAKSARFGLGFVRIGLIPGDGATYFLPRLVGIGKACELVFTSRLIDATEAEKIGLINKMVPDEELAATTHEMAKVLADAPPLALRWAKQALYQSLESGFASQLRFETTGQNTCYATEDFVEAAKSFLEKRPPKYQGK